MNWYFAKAGPEMKAKLLKGLGIKGYLITDGKNPINLFNTVNGLMGANWKYFGLNFLLKK